MSRIAAMMASNNSQRRIVKVTCKITLAMKRNIRKATMTDTTVTTCGVTIFEISRVLLDIIGFVRCVCLDEGRCVHVLIHDDSIHNRGF